MEMTEHRAFGSISNSDKTSGGVSLINSSNRGQRSTATVTVHQRARDRSNSIVSSLHLIVPSPNPIPFSNFLLFRLIDINTLIYTNFSRDQSGDTACVCDFVNGGILSVSEMVLGPLSRPDQFITKASRLRRERDDRTSPVSLSLSQRIVNTTRPSSIASRGVHAIGATMSSSTSRISNAVVRSVILRRGGARLFSGFLDFRRWRRGE